MSPPNPEPPPAQGLPLSPPAQGPAGGAGYYIWPAVWVGDRPQLPEPQQVLGHAVQLDFSQMAHEVVRSDLDQGVTLRAHRDGLMLFDFRAATPRIGRVSRNFNDPDIATRSLARAQLLNAHAACVATAVSELMNFALQPVSVTTRDVLSFGNPDSPNVAFGSNPISMQLYLARFSTTYSSAFGTRGDWRLANRTLVMSIDAVRAASELLASIMRHPNEDLVPLVDVLQRSCTAIGDNNYPLAVVLAWTVCEVVLDRLWDSYIDLHREHEIAGQRVPFLQGKRRDRLREDREYTAAMRLEILSLVNDLSDELYRDCNEARQSRNGWLHELKPVTRPIAIKAIETASAMIDVRSGIRLKLPCSSGFHEQPAPPAPTTT